MRILMVAPEPILRPRGTPLSVFHRIRALTKLGHTVDLVTYPLGDSFELPGLTIHRAPRPPGVHDVGIGPSFAKVALDLPLFRHAYRLARSDRFDLVHTHEEAGVLGSYLSRRLGIPHVYDMHSSLPEQFPNFGRFNWRPVVGAFRAAERYTLGGTHGVIAICPELKEVALARGYRGVITVIENTLQFDESEGGGPTPEAMRAEYGLNGSPTIVYTGTLEPYQGMELLVEAAPAVLRAVPAARFMIVGGRPAQVEALRALTRRVGVESAFHFEGEVKPWEVQCYHQLADVLVTCRTRGSNTPLKIYHYLRAGKSIVATAISSHTQVLDRTTAELVETDPESIASGLVRVLSNDERARELSAAARQLSARRYSETDTIDKLARFLEDVRSVRREGGARSVRDGDRARDQRVASAGSG